VRRFGQQRLAEAVDLPVAASLIFTATGQIDFARRQAISPGG
jgi:hypothetical protein